MRTGEKTCRGECHSRKPNIPGESAQEGCPGPDGSVGAKASDPLKVAGPGRLLRWAVEDGVLEGLGGLGAAGAGGWSVVVLGRVGAEVALTRPHLVKATCVASGEAHERMRLRRGAVLVPGWVRRPLLTFSHEEVLTQELELRVCAARGGRRIGFAKQVLGGDREGSVAVGAKEEEHRVG